MTTPASLSRGKSRLAGSSRALLVLVPLAALLTGCDDQIKRVPIFSTMSTQAGVETYEEQPWTAVEGTVPIDGDRPYGLLEADSLLTMPEVGTAELTLGFERFLWFCAPCHGQAGAGDGSVVGPNRIPALPQLDLRTDRAREFSDGYIWGIIANGRGLMPPYRRVPPHERWYIVAWVRQLQAGVVLPADSVAARATRAAEAEQAGGEQ